MTYRFVALPVGQGDAFFLQLGEFTALIDGGRSRLGLPTLFQGSLNRKSVDVLVCTHNDADHADGILGFLESGLSCSEVWLPALWQDRLDDLLGKAEQFVHELLGDVRKVELDGEHPSLDRLGDNYADDVQTKEQPNEEREVLSAEPQRLHTEFDIDSDIDPLWPLGLPYRASKQLYRDLDCLYDLCHRRRNLFGQALAAAQRIRNIAIACIHRGVPIRWFRYSSGVTKGGRSGELMPLNCSEIGCTLPREPIGSLRFLALSTANRQSLTFCSPPENGYPGVLFTADSDLRSSASIPWRAGMIVTAPHHGSQVNHAAYQRFHAEINQEFDVVWVRSDGNFKSRPGASYLNEPRRFCTLCRTASHRKQIVRFATKNGRWAPINSRGCLCV